MLVAACVVYLPFLDYPFVFCDLNFFATHTVEIYTDEGFGFSLRWLPYVSLGGLYALFGDDFLHAYRLCNMVLHIEFDSAVLSVARLVPNVSTRDG